MQWKFAGSLYFAFVSLALIGGYSSFRFFFRHRRSHVMLNLVHSGYGHSTPATKPGKMFTVAYCTLGIPLAMIMFQVMVVLEMDLRFLTFDNWNGYLVSRRDHGVSPQTTLLQSIGERMNKGSSMLIR